MSVVVLFLLPDFLLTEPCSSVDVVVCLLYLDLLLQSVRTVRLLSTTASHPLRAVSDTASTAVTHVLFGSVYQDVVSATLGVIP
jgi:hypothetical protein